MTSNKYAPVELPDNHDSAIAMAVLREQWAAEAIERDQHGSAKEFKLTALLLRAYAIELAALR